MQKDCIIGLVQMISTVGDTNRNLSRILVTAEEAAGRGASLLCFPESALHGYSPQDAPSLGDSLDSPAIRRLRECASDLQITLLVGMVERVCKNVKPYLAQVIVFPDREPQVYRKVHLGRSEQEYFSAGNDFPVFFSGGMRFAVGICWDWHFPEMAAIYSLKGAELLLAPHASPLVAGNRKEIWLRYLGARAYDNSVYLAACNLIGPNGSGKEFSGGALVLGPKGDILAESGNCGEEIVFANLSAERINTLRSASRASMKESFFLADRRKDLYRELLELNPVVFDVEDKSQNE
ncbi:MAG: amidohydrolase [Desulfitobacterium hafniense]|nr:amidohydrolase [Desulfitobacterium hafniense]